MIVCLSIVCVILGIAVILLGIKTVLLRRAADELRIAFSEKRNADSNTGISLSTTDSKMCRLAADMDRELKLLRQEHLRYTRGDLELKNAVMNISHDLRTPLTAICGYMTLLSEEETTDTVREYLSVIQNRIDALKELSEELFRYSTITSGEAGISESIKETLSLNSALETCIAEFYGAFLNAGIEPEISMPQAPVMRSLNRQSLMRILSNIVSNALKYSDGDFSVSLDENGAFYFRNHAGKLDEVLAGHLFDRFFTVENARNSTGLGLSIARILTEQQGGQISSAYRDGVLTIRLCFPPPPH